jgi:hypothetical protein
MEEKTSEQVEDGDLTSMWKHYHDSCKCQEEKVKPLFPFLCPSLERFLDVFDAEEISKQEENRGLVLQRLGLYTPDSIGNAYYIEYGGQHKRPNVV